MRPKTVSRGLTLVTIKYRSMKPRALCRWTSWPPQDRAYGDAFSKLSQGTLKGNASMYWLHLSLRKLTLSLNSYG